MPVGKANGQHKIANLKLAGICEWNRCQVFRLHLDNGKIEVRICANALRFQLAAVCEGHGDLLGMLDDVTIGDDETLTRVIDNTGTGAMYFTRLGLFGAGLRRDVSRDLDADHRRREFLD